MDPALIRKHKAFKKMAMATTLTVEKKKKTEGIPPPSSGDDAQKKVRPRMAPKLDATTYKTMLSGSSQYRFGVLANIVKFMRARHQDGDDQPLSIEEILDKTSQLDIGQSVKMWLTGEALKNNPKIDVTPDGTKFSYKPVYKIKDGKSLMRLLKLHDLKGLGGIMLEDVQESLPHCEKVLKNRAAEILFITRPIDKKKILFYNDNTVNFTVDEEFKQLWRSSTVDAMVDVKIEEYLEKQGISSMQDTGLKKPKPIRKKPAIKKRILKKPRDNEHVAHILETYDDNNLTETD